MKKEGQKSKSRLSEENRAKLNELELFKNELPKLETIAKRLNLSHIPLSHKILNGDFAINECKYLHEYAENKKLAKQITNIVLNDNVKYYNHCAETYITSFFNTPNERVLNQQLAILKPELKAEHYNIMSDYTKYLLNNLLPNNIVCIGFNVFKRTLDALGISPSDVKFETYKTASGRDRVFYKSVRHENTLIHGVLHLSACHISSVGVDKMREIFKNTIKFD